MSKQSGVSWTDYSVNPIRGTHGTFTCVKVSEGCQICYAEDINVKFGGGIPFEHGADAPRLDLACLDELAGWPPGMVFAQGMGDMFDARLPDAERDQIFDRLDAMPQHIVQVQSHRAGPMQRYLCRRYPTGMPPHYWVGMTVEADRWARRADFLRQIPAAVRYLSIEPLGVKQDPLRGRLPNLDLTGIHWVICGGASGPKWKEHPLDLDAVRDLRDRCVAEGVAFNYKQGNQRRPDTNDLLDGRRWKEFPTPDRGRPFPNVGLRAALDEREAGLLRECMAVITAGLETFFDVGNALRVIRDGRLYRATHPTFADFCAEHWDLSRPRAYQLIDAAAVVAAVSTTVDIAPANEAQARPLTRLPAEQQPAAWRLAVDGLAPGEAMTARRVEDAVRAVASGIAVDPPIVPAPILPTGRYAVILADPPRRYETWTAAGTGRSAEQHYQTQSTDWIASLPIRDLAADDCILFLWATFPLLKDALRVVEAWGFTYKTAAFTWVKLSPKSGNSFAPKLHTGLGHWTRSNAEVCFLATRGSPHRLAADVHSVIEAPIRKHSRKPDEQYDRIERLVAGPYVELFARYPRAGWTAWGDQVGVGSGEEAAG
jgi:protein gp37/N6-adenosine-specific RNA methylase IME4